MLIQQLISYLMTLSPATKATKRQQFSPPADLIFLVLPTCSLRRPLVVCSGNSICTPNPALVTSTWSLCSIDLLTFY